MQWTKESSQGKLSWEDDTSAEREVKARRQPCLEAEGGESPRNGKAPRLQGSCHVAGARGDQDSSSKGSCGWASNQEELAHSIWEVCKVLPFAQRMVGDGDCFEQRTEICCGSQQVPLDGWGGGHLPWGRGWKQLQCKGL